MLAPMSRAPEERTIGSPGRRSGGTVPDRGIQQDQGDGRSARGHEGPESRGVRRAGNREEEEAEPDAGARSEQGGTPDEDRGARPGWEPGEEYDCGDGDAIPAQARGPCLSPAATPRRTGSTAPVTAARGDATATIVEASAA